jgi:hypothetical protein
MDFCSYISAKIENSITNIAFDKWAPRCTKNAKANPCDTEVLQQVPFIVLVMEEIDAVESTMFVCLIPPNRFEFRGSPCP